MACLRLVTFRPPRVLSVPRLRRRIAPSTVRPAFAPYFRRPADFFRVPLVRARLVRFRVVLLRPDERVPARARLLVLLRVLLRVVLRPVLRVCFRAALRVAMRTSPERYPRQWATAHASGTQARKRYADDVIRDRITNSARSSVICTFCLENVTKMISFWRHILA